MSAYSAQTSRQSYRDHGEPGDCSGAKSMHASRGRMMFEFPAAMVSLDRKIRVDLKASVTQIRAELGKYPLILIMSRWATCHGACGMRWAHQQGQVVDTL